MSRDLVVPTPRFSAVGGRGRRLARNPPWKRPGAKPEGGARGEGSVCSFPGGWRRPCSRPAPRAGTASGAHVLAPMVVTPGDFLFQLYQNRDCDLK